MPDTKTTSDRRNFLKKTTFATGLGVLVASAHSESAVAKPTSKANRLPREVWIASVSQDNLEAKDSPSMIRKVLGRMEEVASFEPDIVCLPETFATANLTGAKPPLEERAEEPIGDLSRPFAEFASEHNCYVVCPIITKQDGRFYNSAVFIDRQGELLGEYHKIHPTTEEMKAGISPGPLDPPVFKTDFGIVGAQICFDIEWIDSWRKLQESKAEIVFWPSAFAGGAMVNAKAWQHKYCVVSSTRKDTSKICDITGEAVAKTSRWNHWICAPVNLEKAFLHTWPYVQRFDEIQSKYGRNVRIRNFAEEEWTIIESRSPDVKIADVMKEFELKTLDEHTKLADAEQCECR
ncbi:carbon-nitrogen hydrolase family protein [Novipirellula artificiosorum]|uniref:N-carbamoyl-D-amino acid hydrolase n=1 Tax=Novipirellula artificiosorum TaxID=2528016 RepID=A0A5C6D5B9_9BACT|nr:carbon-nitrogen hydrolase family protein [Novipirellula artificiosorum]TWU32050.1 N-carbamoyl-D-amino acid hydrolase [Novipirellula artificiosorum]